MGCRWLVIVPLLSSGVCPRLWRPRRGGLLRAGRGFSWPFLMPVLTDTNGNGRLNDEVRDRIEDSCDEVGTRGLGKGRINVLRAVTARP